MTTITLTAREQECLNTLGADLPQTTRVINAPAICEEVICGREVTLQDEDLPAKEIYEEFEAALLSLTKMGLVRLTNVWGMSAFSLTQEGQQLL